MMYKAKYLQPRPRTGADTVLHLKTYVPLVVASTVFDYSLNNHPGTLKGTAALKYPGCDLDGDSDYIEVADHDDFTPALTPLSISIWVYMHDASDFIIASKGINNNEGEWELFVHSDDTLRVRFLYNSVSSCWVGVRTAATLTAYENSWINIVLTYDGGITESGVKLYISGIQVDDTSYSNNLGSFVTVENLSHAVWIGRYSNVYANGVIGEVIISKKVLTATEIRSIYETTRSRYGV